jgi:hypothetical protein
VIAWDRRSRPARRRAAFSANSAAK